MGFLDKAKKMAEQAQTKLDEVQKQFNESQGDSAGSQPPPVEYDQHGRPIRSGAPPEPVAADRTPPHGDPLKDQEQPPPPTMSTEPANEDDPYAPPKLTGGDPLAG
jgi:hypothetical protein